MLKILNRSKVIQTGMPFLLSTEEGAVEAGLRRGVDGGRPEAKENSPLVRSGHLCIQTPSQVSKQS